MADFAADRIKETSTTTGTGAYTLAGAVNANYRTAAAAGITNGQTIDYSVEDSANGGWETGIGTWQTGGILQRTTISASSNSGAAVNWPAGTRTISFGLNAAASQSVNTATQTALNLKQDAATAATLTGAQTLTNKTLTAPVLTAPTIRDSTDTTKVLALSMASIATGTTRTVTIPDKSGTLAMLSDVGAGFGGTATSTAELLTGASIPSAATVNLNTATGNRVHITGTTTITAVTLTRGPRTVIFDGILTLTHHATNNNLPGAANITTAVGDRAIYESDGTTVYCVDYVKADGTPVVTPTAAAPAFGAVSGATVLAAVNTTFVACRGMSSTRAFVLRRNAAQNPQLDLVGSDRSVIATLELETGEVVSGQPEIVWQSASEAVCLYQRFNTGAGFNYARAIAVSFSGSTISRGTAVDVAANGFDARGIAQTATKLVVVYGANARILTVSALTITPRAAVTFVSMNRTRIAALAQGDLGTAHVVGTVANNFLRSAILTETSTNTLAVSDEKPLPSTSGSALYGFTPTLCRTSAASTFLAATFGSGPAIGRAYIARPVAGVITQDPIGASIEATAFNAPVGHIARTYSASTALLGMSNDDSFAVAAVNIASVPQISATTPAIGRASAFDFDVFPGSAVALAAYSDLANSSYITIKTVALGTVT